MDEVFADPQVQHLNVAGAIGRPEGGEVRLVTSPLNLDGVKKTIRSAAPETDIDTQDVLAELGYSQGEIATMRAAGVI
jgi:crotonobetainyl-CoA:carnitine CoA-transferase CaiB-like acyl-CoA transferase